MSISDLIAGELLYQQSRNPYYAFSQGLAQTPTPEFENDPITAGLFGFGKNLVGGLAGAYGSSQVDKNISDFTSQILAGLTGGTPSNPRAKSAVDSIYAQQKIADALTPRDRSIEAEIAKAFIQNPQAAQQLSRAGVKIDPTDPESIVKFNKEMSQGMGAPVETVEGLDKYRALTRTDEDAYKLKREDDKIAYDRQRDLEDDYAEAMKPWQESFALANDYIRTVDGLARPGEQGGKVPLWEAMGETGDNFEGFDTWMQSAFGTPEGLARRDARTLEAANVGLGKLKTGPLGSVTEREIGKLERAGITDLNTRSANQSVYEGIKRVRDEGQKAIDFLNDAKKRGIPYTEAQAELTKMMAQGAEEIKSPKAEDASEGLEPNTFNRFLQNPQDFFSLPDAEQRANYAKMTREQQKALFLKYKGL